MIVVEGLDNTGKTTLVEKLSDEFSLEFVPSIGNKHDIQKIRDQAYDSLAKDTWTRRVIYDRCRFISEYIYTPIIRNRPIAFTYGEWLDLIKRYTDMGPQLIIWCNRPLNRIFQTLDEREQLPGVKERLMELEAGYYKMTEMIQFLFELCPHESQVVPYNFELGSYNEVRKAVKDYILEEVGSERN